MIYNGATKVIQKKPVVLFLCGIRKNAVSALFFDINKRLNLCDYRNALGKLISFLNWSSGMETERQECPVKSPVRAYAFFLFFESLFIKLSRLSSETIEVKPR